VALNIKAKSKKKSLNMKNYKLSAKTMPTVESAVHLGIIRDGPFNFQGGVWFFF
jgi:hypothetical protein